MAKLSVSMIVKNEEVMLGRCLESVKDADEIIVLDTGSTDSTGEIARKYTDRYYANEYVWKDDFAEARNLSISKCTGDWILTIDADEFLETDGISKVHSFIDTAPDEIGVFDVHCISEQKTDLHFQPRLYRRKEDIFWKGKIHNYLSKLGDRVLDINIYYGHSPTHNDDPDRALRVLKKVVDDDPECSREIFYLAREYLYRSDYVTALYWYDIYIKKGKGWVQEVVETYYEMARCLWHLQRGDDARTMCVMALKYNADFRDAIELMAEMCGPINSERWREFAKTAQNRNVLFSRLKEAPKEVLKVKPLVHASMKVYNEAKNIEQAIRSIAPYVDDILVVDGAYEGFGSGPSDDGTLEILERLKSEFPIRIVASRLWNNEAEARTEGFKGCNVGDWIVVFDADWRVKDFPKDFKQELLESEATAYTIIISRPKIVRWGDLKIFKYVEGLHYQGNTWTLHDRNERDLFTDSIYKVQDSPWVVSHLIKERSSKYLDAWRSYWRTHLRYANGRELFTCVDCDNEFKVPEGAGIVCPKCKSGLVTILIGGRYCG